MAESPLWKVVGGYDRGGVLVRDGHDLASPQKGSRLATGALVKEIERTGERLRYEKVSGDGPETGWVTPQVGIKVLLQALGREEGRRAPRGGAGRDKPEQPPHPGHAGPEAAGSIGIIGEALWQSPLAQLPAPPWAPRRDFVALCAGMAKNSWRKLFVLGGSLGSGQFLDDIWCSQNGGATWDRVECGAHWAPRSRFGVASGYQLPGPEPDSRALGIFYVVGGYNSTGHKADIWASDTQCRSWHRMNEHAPFGRRADVACATVPGSPLTLVVGGGISSDVHRDLWLSRDGGETFVQVDAPDLPRGPAFRIWSPHLLCAATSASGRVFFWRLRIDDGAATPAKPSAELEPLYDEVSDEYVMSNADVVPSPPRLALDLFAKVALTWEARHACVAAHPLPAEGAEESDPMTDPSLLRDVAATAMDRPHVLTDMDSAFHRLRNGFVWVLSADGRALWVSDRARYRAQDMFLRLLGLRLSDMHGLPLEPWLGRVRPMLLPRPRQVAAAGGGGERRAAHARSRP